MTKADVDTFLSESARPEFSYRLLIATTNRIGKTADRTIKDQEKPASFCGLSALEHAAVNWPASPSALAAKPAKPAKPRPHQRQAIKAVTRGFVEHARGQLVMACGTGKTLTALWIAEKTQSNRTLVLVPSLSLLAQTFQAWAANAAEPFKPLFVCSDETVRGEDHFTSSTSDLAFPVTTDPVEIASALRRKGRLVVFATYQSSPRLAEALALPRVPGFQLAISDEAHRCAGPTSSDYGTILDDEQIPAQRRLFMTATPRYFTERVRRAAGEADYELASMDDEAVFGPVLHRLSFSEARVR